jgi:excisionase family DNA binding protein
MEEGRNRLKRTYLIMETIELDPLLTVPEVASWLRKKSQTVKEMVRQGKLPGVRVGKCWLFSKTDLTEWLKNQK